MSLVILCSGQAGQHRAMLDGILDAEDCAELCEAASSVLGQPVAAWWSNLDEAALFANAHAQFAIALYQAASWQRLSARLPVAPAAVAGYSLGEVIAWHISGALGARELLSLVRERASLMDDSSPPAEPGAHCMALWRGRSTPTMRQALADAVVRHGVAVAIHRPGGQCVLGGPAAAMAAFEKDAAVADGGLKPLAVGVPSHTPWLAGAENPFRARVRAMAFGDPRFPVIAGVDGAVQRQGAAAADSLAQQLARPLHWDWCLETLAGLGVDVGIELGPGNDLSLQVESELSGAAARALHEFASADEAVAWVARYASRAG
ncbi:MAG: acyltransferase domain-containing protein [Rhodocyclaceae bacterium]|nr:acyltransferase domain-containing protein [Rhodocyclaceae bacterium]